MTAAQLLRALRKDGWQESRQVGSHLKLRHPREPGHVVVPIHSGESIKPRTLLSILDQAGLSVEDLRALL